MKKKTNKQMKVAIMKIYKFINEISGEKIGGGEE